jgi:hypothetical protein
MFARLAIVAAVTLSAGACAPAPTGDVETLREIRRHANILFDAEPRTGPVMYAGHNKHLNGAKFFDLADEGLYIEIWTFFVEERGYFVPRDPQWTPNRQPETDFTPIGEGVFYYRIAG